MDKPESSPPACGARRVRSAIRCSGMSERRARFTYISILILALLSLPGLLYGQEKRIEAKDESYLLLSDGTIHTGSPPSSGLFIRGTVSSSNVFRPVGNVEGDGELADHGVAGWVELSHGTFVPQDMGMSPRPPYVKGFLGSGMGFRPETREIIY
jgi:hypothetical protein